jgi:quercetin dioxygenase-like cupin family protein
MKIKKVHILLCFATSIVLSCKSVKITKTEVTTLAKTSESWNGDALPKYLEGIPEVTILKIIIPPKTKLDLHKHPAINAGVILKGTLTVISDKNKTRIFKTGDAIVELVNTWHFGRNDGTVPVEIIVFYAGIKGKPITILKKDN